MTNNRILELVVALARDSEIRRKAASELARFLEADDLLILTFEKDHGSYLPACGFPQTLFQHRRWKEFTGQVATKSSAQSLLCYPNKEQERTAYGWRAQDGSIFILFDGTPKPENVLEVLSLIPLITPTFQKERLLITSAATATISAQSAQQALQLAESLDSVRRQLQATVILREQDIAEREKIEQQLEQTNRDLQRVNDDLNQFTFAATHDVREPLRMMTIYVQLLQKEMQDDLSETALEYIEHVVSGAKRISGLIDGLLQFTRIGGSPTVELTEVDAGAALIEALEDLKLVIIESRARIIREDLPLVMADHLHLRQLFQNLVGNAIKYRCAEVDPVIQISARREGQMWLFAVQDNGIGIAPEHHDQIFLPFKRLHGSDIAGAGIGLATCKRIVERYGGEIGIESAETHGSIFHFSFPAVKATLNAISYRRGSPSL